MSLPRIISKVYDEPWCITPAKHRAIQSALESHLAGISLEDNFETDEAPGSNTQDGVAVIPIHGIIGKHMSMLEMACGGCSVDSVSAMLGMAAEDPNVTAVVLDINSPGGTVTGVPELANQIFDLKQSKPVFAFTDCEMCSAAYWIAAQADAIYATSSAAVGSIGVYMALLDISRQLEMDGVKVNAISAGKWKLAGASFKPLTDDERAMFQAGVDRTHAQFKAAILRNRTINEDVMEGQVYDGEEALAANLTDAVANDLGEAIDLARLYALTFRQ